MGVVCHQSSKPVFAKVIAGLLCAGTLAVALGAAPDEQAGGKNPTISVGGIQVAKVTAPKDEMMSRGRLLNKLATGKGVASNFLNKIWDANGFVDNFYRSVAYLHGEKKALAKGATSDAAKEAGLKLADKILQDWDSMVPLERQIVKQIFPFYGWMHHVMKYASTYPIDHPLRASIVGSLSRAEQADWDSGLPQDFSPVRNAAGDEIWLPSRIYNQQLFLIAGRNLLVERRITFTDYDIAPGDFAGQRQEARGGGPQVARPTSASPGALGVLPAAPGTGTCRSCPGRSGRAPRRRCGSPRRVPSRPPSTALPASDGWPFRSSQSIRRSVHEKARRARSAAGSVFPLHPLVAGKSLTMPCRKETHHF